MAVTFLITLRLLPRGRMVPSDEGLEAEERPLAASGAGGLGA